MRNGWSLKHNPARNRCRFCLFPAGIIFLHLRLNKPRTIIYEMKLIIKMVPKSNDNQNVNFLKFCFGKRHLNPLKRPDFLQLIHHYFIHRLFFFTAYPTAIWMWLLSVSIMLLPTVIMASSHYRIKVSILCGRALAWVLRLLRGRVCVRSEHAFVFSKCTHGKAYSVLETFDLYAESHASLCIGPETGK